jgi:DNA-binding transcriptional MerR regulator
MSSMHQEALFNLKAVVQQTGLKPDTLRAWERRYGLPQPERSEGGHRLYSQRDIDTVRWLMARQREGLSISHAVELWEQIEETSRDPLVAEMPLSTRPPAGALPQVMGESLLELRKGWKSACLAYDEKRAEQVIAQAFAIYPPEVVAVDVLQKAVAEIGEGWYQGQVTVQQEHFCSELAVRRLEALVMATPPSTRLGRLVAACPPDESHVLGLLLLTLLLRRQGWDVVYLGANVPLERLEVTVVATRPDLVILAAQRLHTAATLRDMAYLLQEHAVPTAFGGLIFSQQPGLRARIPGHFLGERLDLAPQEVEWLMTGRRTLPIVEPVAEEYQQALAHFQDRLALIEAELFRALQDRQLLARHLTLANRELAVGVEDALALGDMEYLGTDLAWVEGLLHNREVGADDLRTFLEVYRGAAAKYLDKRGEPILAWLRKVTEGK